MSPPEVEMVFRAQCVGERENLECVQMGPEVVDLDAEKTMPQTYGGGGWAPGTDGWSSTDGGRT